MAHRQSICSLAQELLEPCLMRHFDSRHIPKPRQPLVLAHFEGPTDLEIGAGQGLHAIRYSVANLGRRLIAIERTTTKFESFEQRVRHHHLENLVPVHGDAVSVLTHNVPDHFFHKIFLLYPNPYPKAKQRNLRWHQSPTMELLKTKLQPGGLITVATNLKWFADEAEEFMTETWGFRMQERTPVANSSQARTHFERKYLLRGETCHNLIFQLQ